MENMDVVDFNEDWLDKKESGMKVERVIKYVDPTGKEVGVRMMLRIIPALEKRHLIDVSCTIGADGEPDMDMDKYQREIVKLATELDGSAVQKLLENKGMGFWNALYREVEFVNGNPKMKPNIRTSAQGEEEAKN